MHFDAFGAQKGKIRISNNAHFDIDASFMD